MMATETSGGNWLSEGWLADWFSGPLAGWLAVPIQAMQGPEVIAILLAFGAVHALLPGHGKALLAARQAVNTDASSPVVLPLLDGLALAGTRSLVAFALVVGSVQAAQALGFTLPVQALRLLAGLALMGIGLHFAIHAFSRWWQPVPAGIPGPLPGLSRKPKPGSLNAALVLLALTPEPVALAIASYGVAKDELQIAGWAVLSLALGMGLTLGLTAILAARHANRLSGLASMAGVPIGVILLAAGAIVAADAW